MRLHFPSTTRGRDSAFLIGTGSFVIRTRGAAQKKLEETDGLDAACEDEISSHRAVTGTRTWAALEAVLPGFLVVV